MKTHHTIPVKGISAEDLSGRLNELKLADAKWDKGKVFGFVYHPGDQYAEVSDRYLNAFFHESTLNPGAFPSLKKFERKITGMAVELMHGNSQTAGSVTSGGTESIFLALKVARDSVEKHSHDLTPHEVILPETAHPAFLKACQILGLKAVIVKVDENKRADLLSMEEAINPRTILIAASAPCFPYGVVDPIEKIGKMAGKHNLFFHVDACLGGFMLPFLEDLNYAVPPFDFRVHGVTSISLDAHKYGYAPKGVSIILYKNRKLRKKQFFVDTEWCGGIFASTTLLGTKSGGPLAGCWAALNHIGKEGYRSIARGVMNTCTAIKKGIERHQNLHIIGDPDMSVLAFTSDKGDIFNIGDALMARGWFLDRLQFPDALHLTITQLNIGKEKEFLSDLDDILGESEALNQQYRVSRNTVKYAGTMINMLPGFFISLIARLGGRLFKERRNRPAKPQAALYGITGSLKNRKNAGKLVLNLLDGIYRSIYIGLFAMLLLSAPIPICGQEISQTVRGTVLDAETNRPLYAATLALYSDSMLVASTITNQEGNFRFESVAVGRYSIRASYIGFKATGLSDIIVNSVKEVILNIPMEESPMELEEISVSATVNKGQALNKLAYVSARTFSVEEAERYAGSRADPARMAANYAGVQGNDDSNNDLVIRGNSPLGVLWRLEGVNIPNPNHFAVSGSTGGPVTILNNKVLSLSDFMTGAYPAEFGNSIAGVFDLNLRNGNNEHHEFMAQLGFLGIELLAEGPVSRASGSSYLASYRYSTMDLFQAFGIQIGTDAVPRYQDLSFKLNFPLKKQGSISLFGIGGASAVDILASEQLYPEKDVIYGAEAMDEHFRTSMGVLGLNFSKPLGSSSFIKITASGSIERQENHLDKVYRHIDEGIFVVDSLKIPFIGYRSDQVKYSLSAFWNKKVSRKLLLKTGFIQDFYAFNMHDSIFNEAQLVYITRLDHEGLASLFQPYFQGKYNANEKLSFNAGIHGQYLHLETNQSWALEPRLGMRYQAGQKHTLSFGTGLHSQMIPTYVYFAQLVAENGTYVQPNLDLDFMKSYQTVVGWDFRMNQNLRLKVESYYQYLYNIPVEKLPSSYSILDEGHDMNRFFPDSLVNNGSGRNYGLEVTVEKFFSSSYFLLFTGSLYEANRTGSDQLSYNSVFNGGYILNALGSKEFTWGEKKVSTFTVGSKITLAGGKRYTPIDLDASEDAGEAVYIDDQRNALVFDPYFRIDLKFTYRINALRSSHELGLDIVNVTNRENILKQTYISGATPPVQEIYQLGILPIFYYKIEF